ncbi:hypothetical protein KKF55_01815 [Patescibacteria group bacterium]|nr:hypothetical protein [Patescibacteria group bacterium]
MGFKEKFLGMFGSKSSKGTRSSFDGLTKYELDMHLAIGEYYGFKLTQAIRPSCDLKVVPSEGYRHDTYHYEDDDSQVPILIVAASREKLWNLFIDLLDPLGEIVDVVVETSHDRDVVGHNDIYRDHIDLPVLESIMEGYREQIINDGCLGIAVLNPDIVQEVQFNEHKLLIIYGEKLAKYERVLATHGVQCDERIKFINEAEHVHSTSDRYAEETKQLIVDLGMDHDGWWRDSS